MISIWLLTVIITRLLGYAAAGDLTLAMAMGNVFALLQMYGVRSFQSSDVRFQFTAGDYLRARLLTMVMGCILGTAALLLLGYSGTLLVSVLLFVLFKSSEAFSDVLFGEDQRRDRLELAGYSMLLRGVLTVFAFFTGAYFFRTLNAALLLAAAVAILLTLFFDLPLYRRTVRDHMGKTSRGLSGILRSCFPLLITTIIPTMITAIPRVALERFYGAEALGYYGNVSTPSLLLTTIAPTILLAFLPTYGRAFQAGDWNRILKTWGLTVLGILCLGAICLLGALLLAKPVLALFYTEAVLPYVHYLYPLLGAMTLYAVTICANAVLVPMRENRVLMGTALISLVLCLALSYPLVRAWGMGGAVAVLAVSYGVQALVQAIWLLRLCLGKKGKGE